MKLNNLYLCFVLWAVVCLIAIICAAIRRCKIKKSNELKLAYIRRIMLLVGQSQNITTLFREVYYGFNNKRLKQILIKAMKLQEKAKDKETYSVIGFKYIERKIGCEPILAIHKYLVHEELVHGSLVNIDAKKFNKYADEHIDAWQQEGKTLERLIKKELLKGVIWQQFFFFMNMIVYIKICTSITLDVWIIVNTIGCVLFIILDYEWAVVDAKIRDGKLAKGFSGKKRALARTARLNSMYQLVGGMGLIVNLALFVSQWLEQEALF